MAEVKKKVPMLGFELDCAAVPAVKTEECFNTYVLEDGSVLKVKSVATAFLRVEGQYLPDGSPIYLVMATPVATVIESTLKKEKPEKAN